MIYGSVCSGIEAASVAWGPLGWQPAWFAEIDKFPSAVLAHRFPDVTNLGDFTQIGEEHGPIELLVGGTPCQSFSVAGRRLGLDDPRGNLAIEFLRLAERLRPRWLLFENVPGLLSSDKGRDFYTFLDLLGKCGYGYAYRVLDAQYFGVPQRRRRVFVVGYFGDWRPAAAVFFERESLRWNPAPRREARQRTTAGFEVGPSGGNFTDLAPTLDSRASDGPRRNQLGLGNAQPIAFQQNTRDEVRLMGGDGDIAGALAGQPGMKQQNYIAQPYTPAGLGEYRPGVGTLRSEGGDCGHGSETLIAFGSGNTSGEQDVAGADSTSQRYDFDTETLIMHENKEGNLAGADYERSLRSGASHSYQFVIKGAAIGRTPEAGPQRGEVLDDGSVYTLDATDVHAIAAPVISSYGTKWNGNGGATTGENFAGWQYGMQVRRLTPRECERLQGFPDDFTLVPYRNGMAADGPRYRAIGNSMAVPVIRWLGQRIQLVEEVLEQLARDAA